MSYVGLMLGIPIAGTIAYIVHVVRLRRRAHDALHAEAERFLAAGGDEITTAHRAARRYGEHPEYDD